MKHQDRFDVAEAAVAELDVTDVLLPALSDTSAGTTTPRPQIVVGELVAIREHGAAPLVVWPGQAETVAVPARAIIDLQANHIGRHVLLLFESIGSAGPIVIGLVREQRGWPGEQQPAHVEVQGDGERMIVSAKRQLVLRCGAASITLTSEGKVLIQGKYVSSRSSGVHRIKGGSVQIN